ncbi:MAG: ribokinase [Chitinophagaceae bacterium]|nr:ribokinase [Anaerolineae bacterium]
MLTSLIPQLAGRRILVVGDIILDEYLFGRATRMSREAPIPVLEFEARRHIPGGAANPSANIAALGSTAIQIGGVGGDEAGKQLYTALQTAGIDTVGIVVDPSRPTTVKTRIMAQMGLRFPQQVARLDTLSREPMNPFVETQILANITQALGNCDAILLSDYHIGLLTPELIAAIHTKAREFGLMLTADAQGELKKYARFNLVKCNADEASAYLRRSLTTDADFAAAALDLCQRLTLTGGMFITRGGDGITFATADDQSAHVPAPAVTDVYDTVGAGDTTIAVLTLAAAAGIAYQQAAVLANVASGLVVRRVGNYAPSPEELTEAIRDWGIDES